MPQVRQGRTTDTEPPFPFTALARLCVLRPAVGRPCPGKHVPFGWPQNKDTWNNLKSGVPVSQASPAKITHSHPRAQIRAEGLSEKIKLEGALFSQDQEPQFLWEKLCLAGDNRGWDAQLGRGPSDPKEKNPV